MGLLTNCGPQHWHPAKDDTKEMCRKAADICKHKNIELGKLAMFYFTQLQGPTTFLVGMQTEELLDVNLNAYFNGLSKDEEDLLELLKKEYYFNLN